MKLHLTFKRTGQSKLFEGLEDVDYTPGALVLHEGDGHTRIIPWHAITEGTGVAEKAPNKPPEKTSPPPRPKTAPKAKKPVEDEIEDL